MLGRINQWLAAPVFEDEDKTRAAGLLNVMLLSLLVVSSGIAGGTLVLYGLPAYFDDWFTVVSSVALGAMTMGLLFLLHRGHVALASGVLSSAIWVIVTLWLYTAGCIRDTSVTGYFLVIIIAGLLLGGRAAAVFGWLCILAATGAYYIEAGSARVALSEVEPLSLILLIVCLGVTTLLLRFAVRGTALAFERARRNERGLAERNRELAQTVANLVAARIEQARLYKAAQQEIAERVRADAIRQQVEDALRQSEARYKSLFEDSPISLWEEDFSQVKRYFDDLRTSGVTDFRAYFEHHPEAIVHCAGLIKVLDVNQATLTLLGARDKDELLVRLSEVMAQDALPVLREELITLAQGGQQFESEEVNRTLTGEVILVNLYCRVAPGYEHSLAKVLISVLDVTARKRAEQEREKLIAELEAKNAELERFTYTVSHDLKSPLITIQGFLGFVEQAAVAGQVEQVKQDLARISGAADKMHKLLGELLELSRIGRLMNPPEDIPLGELAREAVSMVAGRLTGRGVRVDIAPDLPVVYGDRTRLREVLENLLDNAVKYMGEQPAPRVEIGVRGEEGEQVFCVRDNGLGIDPRYHHKVFGLFEKLDPKAEGTGVGLAIVKRIVEVHGGRIWVESEGEGKGSTFYFTLGQFPKNQKSSGGDKHASHPSRKNRDG